MILAAGIGSRLKSLTSDKPKALVEIAGKPMLQWAIEHLIAQGITHLMINIHHFGDQIPAFLKLKKNFGVRIDISDERDILLDTGGAVKKASGFFTGDSPILIQNVDVISEVNLRELEDYHVFHKALCTLCVRQRPSGRGLLFDDQMHLKGWVNSNLNQHKWVTQEEPDLRTFAFSGIYLVQSEFASLLPFDGRFSIIDAWLKMAQSHKIIGYEDQSTHWFDIGTKEKIDHAEAYLKKRK